MNKPATQDTSPKDNNLLLCLSIGNRGGRMKKWLLAAALALSASGFATTASAAPILWTISNATFDQGGVLSGSFVYNPDTHAYSSVNMSTTAGTVGSAVTFRSVCSDPACPIPLIPGVTLPLTNPAFTGDMTGLKMLWLFFPAGIADSGGAGQFFSVTGTCLDAECQDEPSDMRIVEIGAMTGTPYVAPVTAVPTLSQWALVLMSAALGGLAFLRKKSQGASSLRALEH